MRLFFFFDKHIDFLLNNLTIKNNYRKENKRIRTILES